MAGSKPTGSPKKRLSVLRVKRVAGPLLGQNGLEPLLGCAGGAGAVAQVGEIVRLHGIVAEVVELVIGWIAPRPFLAGIADERARIRARVLPEPRPVADVK